MQRPRHAPPGAGDRLRAVARAGVVTVLALPSVVGVGALVTSHGAPPAAAAPAAGTTAPRPGYVVEPFAAAPSPARGATAARPSASASPAPGGGARPAAPAAAVARSGVRIARAARSAAAQVADRLVTHVVGLGDSVPAGTGCGCTDYVQLLAQDLGRDQGVPVAAANLAVPGQTTGGLLDQLAGPDAQQAVAAADVVVVTIGANDVEGGPDPASCSLPSGPSGPGVDDAALACYDDEMSALAPNLDRIAAQLAALPTSHGARVLLTGYWNAFLDGSVARARGDAYVAVADAVTRAVNRRIAAAAAAHGATFVDLFTPFRGSDGSRDCTPLLADDGDHPNAAGHQVVAQALAGALGH